MAYQHCIEVIVSPCKLSSRGEGWVTSGNDIRERFTDPKLSLAAALAARAPGMGVIIRPSFNENHLNPIWNSQFSYREWRSFNGGLFQEIHFLLSSSVTMVRLDSELIVPSPPSD